MVQYKAGEGFSETSYFRLGLIQEIVWDQLRWALISRQGNTGLWLLSKLTVDSFGPLVHYQRTTTRYQQKGCLHRSGQNHPDVQ